MAFLPQNEALLQVKPVQEQRWDLPFSIGDLLQPANNERTPINPIDAANQQQALQSKNTLENAQAVGAAQEANQKQRGFQLSMLNGVFALPPEQQEAALKSVVPMMNRLGGTQYPEDMSLAQAKMLAMANLSLEQIPQFQLNSQALPLMQGFAQRAGVNLGQPNQQSNPQSPQLPTTGTPMPANGITPNQAGGAPIPQGGGTPIDPNMMTN